MPIFRLEATEQFPVDVLRGDALVKMSEFCGGQGMQMTRDSFMSNAALYNMGCKYLIYPTISFICSFTL